MFETLFQCPFKTHFLAMKNDLATGGLFNTCDLPHESGFASAIVAHDRHMLALAQHKVCTFKRMHTAIVFGQAFGLQNDV
jgi:hypothetical protein